MISTGIVLEAVAIVVSIVAICVSFKSYDRGNKLAETANDIARTANKLTEMTNKMAMAELELHIREQITDCECRYKRTAMDLQAEKDASKKELLENILESHLEDYLNIYDDACGMYRDGKVDRLRFKKRYSIEIRNLVENPTFSEKFRLPQSSYKAICAVYDEWFNLENRDSL